MKKYLLLILVIAFSCQQPDDSAKEKGKHQWASYFTDISQTDLEYILQFFDQKICTTQKMTKVDECYQEYFQGFSKKVKTDGLITLDFETDKLITNLSPKTLQTIWRCNPGKEKTSRQVFPATYAPRHFLQIDPNGSYYEFLKDYAANSKNTAIQQYWQNYSMANSNSASTVANMLQAYDKLDYENPDTRLLVAIYYLSLEFNFNPNTPEKIAICERILNSNH